MGAAGQALVEFILLTALFVVFVMGVMGKIPLTFSQSAPYLGAKIQSRLETGGGFGSGKWVEAPAKPRGGMKD